MTEKEEEDLQYIQSIENDGKSDNEIAQDVIEIRKKRKKVYKITLLSLFVVCTAGLGLTALFTSKGFQSFFSKTPGTTQTIANYISKYSNEDDTSVKLASLKDWFKLYTINEAENEYMKTYYVYLYSEDCSACQSTIYGRPFEDIVVQNAEKVIEYSPIFVYEISDDDKFYYSENIEKANYYTIGSVTTDTIVLAGTPTLMRFDLQNSGDNYYMQITTMRTGTEQIIKYLSNGNQFGK